MANFVSVKSDYNDEELEEDSVQLLQELATQQQMTDRMSTFADVKNEYEKNEDLKKEDVQLLEQWIERQQHLPKISELDLILFLHCSYYNVDSAKKYIEAFYLARARCPEFFKNRNPSVNTKVLETMLFVPFPSRTSEGYQVFFCKLIDLNPGNFILDEHIKSFDMAITLMLHLSGTTAGQILLVDAAGFSFRHILKISLIAVRKFLLYLEEALPIRLKKLIVINTPYCVHKFLMLIRPFFSKELANNLQTYTDKFDEVYELIPQEHFPSDYGGNADSIVELTMKRNKMLLDHEDFFVEGEKEIADESKRNTKRGT